jgi:hypothetical protein
VVWPLLQPESDAEDKSAAEQPQSRTCYLSKIVTLFNLWISLEKYKHWFFVANAKAETVVDWTGGVFRGASVAPGIDFMKHDFGRKVLRHICTLKFWSNFLSKTAA